MIVTHICLTALCLGFFFLSLSVYQTWCEHVVTMHTLRKSAFEAPELQMVKAEYNLVKAKTCLLEKTPQSDYRY